MTGFQEPSARRADKPALLERHPGWFIAILSGAAVAAAVTLTFVFYQTIIRHQPGLVPQLLSALAIATIVAPAFLWPLIRLAAKLAAAKSMLGRQALSDGLTGLPNGRALRQELKKILAEAGPRSVATLQFVDLDNFKEVNDSFGHALGDDLLVSVAQRLSERLPGDLVTRFGADKFVVVRTGLRDAAAAAALANEIRKSLADTIVVDGYHLRVSATVGYASAPNDASDADALLRAADQALSRAKRDEDVGFVGYSRRLDLDAQRRRAIAGELRAGAWRESLRLNFQPLLRNGTLSIASCEALVRWDHPQFGEITPTEFVALAEAEDLMVEIGATILERACRAAGTWPDDVRLAVNISPSHLCDDRLVKSVERALLVSGLTPDRLELEVTETTLIKHPRRAARALASLAEMGVSRSLDDFGTGYAGLKYLQELNFDKIKIDKRYLLNAASSERDAILLEGIARLAKQLGLSVVVEGVETDAQAALLAPLAVDEVQGFYFSRPISERRIHDFLNAWPAFGDNQQRANGKPSDSDVARHRREPMAHTVALGRATSTG